MKANSASRSLVVVVGITLFMLMIAAALPAVSQTSKGVAARATAAQTASPELVRAQSEWHQALLQLPHPKPGCYRATYDGTFPNPSVGLSETGPIANSGPSFSDT